MILARRKATVPRLIWLLKHLRLTPNSKDLKGISKPALRKFYEANPVKFPTGLLSEKDGVLVNAILDQVGSFYEGNESMEWDVLHDFRGITDRRRIKVTREQFRTCNAETNRAKLAAPESESTMDKAVRIQAAIWGKSMLPPSAQLSSAPTSASMRLTEFDDEDYIILKSQNIFGFYNLGHLRLGANKLQCLPVLPERRPRREKMAQLYSNWKMKTKQKSLHTQPVSLKTHCRA